MVNDNETSLQKRARLEREIKDLQGSITSKQHQLDSISRTCNHEWSSTTYDPIVKEGYLHPGDPPGTMGIDWRGPQWVPRQETSRWRRNCKKCGKIEYTQSYGERTVKEPKF